MSVEASKSGESTPGSDNVEIAGETDEGFVQIESKKKQQKPERGNAKKQSKTEVAKKKAEIAAAIGDDDPLVSSGSSEPPKAQQIVEPGNEEEEIGEKADGGGSGGWWGGLGGLVQAAKSTAAKVGSVAEAALNELTKDDEVEEEGQEGKEVKEEDEDGWENAGDAEVNAEKSKSFFLAFNHVIYIDAFIPEKPRTKVYEYLRRFFHFIKILGLAHILPPHFPQGTVKALNFPLHGNFPYFLARSMALLGGFGTNNEYSRTNFCKSKLFSVFLSLYFHKVQS